MSTICKSMPVHQSAVMAKSYPSELVRHLTLRDGARVIVRPIQLSDWQIEKEFVQKLSNESRYFRFMGALRELDESMLNRFTRIDYDKEMALIAVSCENGQEIEVGVARYMVNPDGTSCDFAIAVADAWQQRGLGLILMLALVNTARTRVQSMEGMVMSANHRMLGLMNALGFSIEPVPGDPATKYLVKDLTSSSPGAPPSSGFSAADVN